METPPTFDTQQRAGGNSVVAFENTETPLQKTAPRRKSRMMPRESKAYEIQESEFGALRTANGAAALLFSLGSAIFSLTWRVPADTQQPQIVTDVRVIDLLYGIGVISYGLGVVALVISNSIERRIKRESGEPGVIDRVIARIGARFG